MGRGARRVVGALRLTRTLPTRSPATRSTPPLRSRRRASDDEIVWVDLDLDFEVTDGDVEIEDEAQFHDHARTMGYPDQVVRGAWSGISTIAARYTTGDWPFDGTMQEWLDGA